MVYRIDYAPCEVSGDESRRALPKALNITITEAPQPEVRQ